MSVSKSAALRKSLDRWYMYFVKTQFYTRDASSILSSSKEKGCKKITRHKNQVKFMYYAVKLKDHTWARQFINVYMNKNIKFCLPANNSTPLFLTQQYGAGQGLLVLFLFSLFIVLVMLLHWQWGGLNLMENNNECPSMKESMNGGKRNILGLCE